MATNFPTSLDALTNPTLNDNLNSVGVIHADQHANANDAIEALQAKVGINDSAVTSTLDYLLKNAASISPGHKHNISDIRTSSIASLPSASTAGAGATYRITDIGGGTALVYSDGTYWKPLNGFMVLESGSGTSVTGTITETAIKTVTLPAKLATPSMAIIILTLFGITNNSNNKRFRIRLGGTSGTAFYDVTSSINASGQVLTVIRNAGATNAQVGPAFTSTGLGNSGNALVTGTVDTAASDTDIVTTAALTNTGDSVKVEHQLVLLASI